MQQQNALIIDTFKIKHTHTRTQTKKTTKSFIILLFVSDIEYLHTSHVSPIKPSVELQV